MKATVFKPVRRAALAGAVLFAWATGAAADDCSTFRLDQQPDNPLAPMKGTALTPEQVKAKCAEIKDEDRKSSCLVKSHYPDEDKSPMPSNPSFVPVRNQGNDGNCFAQAVANLANYRRAAKGLKPDTTPEYISTANCAYTMPPTGSEPDVAADQLNGLPECDLSDLMNADFQNTQKVMDLLAGAYDEFQKTGEVACGGDLIQAELKKGMDGTSSYFNDKDSKGGVSSVSLDVITKEQAQELRQIFEKAFTSPENSTEAKKTHDLSIAKWTSDVGCDAHMAVASAKPPIPAGSKPQAEEKKKADLLKGHVNEATRCEITRAVLKEYCKAHPRKKTGPSGESLVQPKPLKLKKSLTEKLVDENELKKCDRQFSEKMYKEEYPKAKKDDIDAFLKGEKPAQFQLGCGKESLDYTKLSAFGRDKAAYLNDCYQKLLKPARNQQLNDMVAQVQSKKEPVIFSISNATNLMAVAQGEAVPNGRKDSKHVVMAIGRSKNEQGGKCGMWIRNSWGSTCPFSKKSGHYRFIHTADYQCDPTTGNIWISNDMLAGENGVFETFQNAEDSK